MENALEIVWVGAADDCCESADLKPLCPSVSDEKSYYSPIGFAKVFPRSPADIGCHLRTSFCAVKRVIECGKSKVGLRER